MTPQRDHDDFTAHAHGKPPGLLREFIAFLAHNKKWWLLPIVIMLLIVGLLVAASPALAPFIYALF